MTWDSMLLEEWPSEWVPFTVDVRPAGEVLTLVAHGSCDSWTAGALLRTLVAVHEPSYTHVRVDLRQALGVDGGVEDVLRRCREFATREGAMLSVLSPPAVSPPSTMGASGSVEADVMRRMPA